MITSESVAVDELEIRLKKQTTELKKFDKGISAEISESTQPEEDFLNSEEKFRILAENSPDIIVRFDIQSRQLYFRQAAVDIYSYSQEEIKGKTHNELGSDPEKAKFWKEHNEKVFSTGKTETMEFDCILPQRKKYYFNTLIAPEFVNDEVASVLTISRNVTDVKKTESTLKETLDNLEEMIKKRTEEIEKAYRSLKESEKCLAEAQKIAHLGSWNWNIVSNELYWSDEIYRIFGLSPQEFGATYDAFLSYVHPEDRDCVNNAVKGALEGKPYSIDHRIILKGGEERIVHEQGEVIFENGNVPVRMAGIVQDITERKKIEKALGDGKCV